MVETMHMKKGMRRLLLGAFVALLVYVIPAYAQDIRDEIRIKLYAVGSVFLNEGFDLTHEIIWGRLPQGQSENIGIELDGNMEYYIMGVCDNDCYNLNIDFYTMNGELLGYDHEDSEAPFIHIPHGYHDRYIIRMSMAGCATFTCNYAMAVFGRY